jgi:hypothetical protein
VGVLEAPFDFPPFAQHTKRNRNEKVYFHVLPVLSRATWTRANSRTLTRTLTILPSHALRNAQRTHTLIHNHVLPSIHSLIRLRGHKTGIWKVQASSMWFVLLLEMRDVCCRCRCKPLLFLWFIVVLYCKAFQHSSNPLWFVNLVIYTVLTRRPITYQLSDLHSPYS